MLKPCPFCGAHHPRIEPVGESHVVRCQVCDARGPGTLSATMAAKHWNDRPTEERARLSLVRRLTKRLPPEDE